MTTTPTNAAGRAHPMPPAALGMWLFVAGEAMFFAGLLSAFLVLQSTPGERALFLRSARVVTLPPTAAAAALLVATSAVLWRAGRRLAGQILAGLVAVLFIAVQAHGATLLMSHHTVVTPTAVYDGSFAAGRSGRLSGVRVPLPPAFDVHRVVPSDLAGGTHGSFDIAPADVRADVVYGPSRNNYFACYFLVNAAHAVHVGGGLVALAWLCVGTARSTATAAQTRAVTLYWQFVNGVGLLSLILLTLG